MWWPLPKRLNLTWGEGDSRRDRGITFPSCPPSLSPSGSSSEIRHPPELPRGRGRDSLRCSPSATPPYPNTTSCAPLGQPRLHAPISRAGNFTLTPLCFQNCPLCPIQRKPWRKFALSLGFPLFSLGQEQVTKPETLTRSELLLCLAGRFCSSSGANLGMRDFGDGQGSRVCTQGGTSTREPAGGQGGERQPDLTALPLTPLMGKRS